MRLRKTDPFVEQICINALAATLIELYSSVLDFAYFFTFKKELKCYEKDFKDPDEQPIVDLEFYAKIADPVVKHCLLVSAAMIDFSLAFNLRHGIQAEEISTNPNLNLELIKHYLPKLPRSMANKSYARLSFYYERYLEESINCLYYYCCILSLERYQLPLSMKKQINQISEYSFRMVNTEHNEVALLANLIFTLIKADGELKHTLKKGVRKPKF